MVKPHDEAHEHYPSNARELVTDQIRMFTLPEGEEVADRAEELAGLLIRALGEAEYLAGWTQVDVDAHDEELGRGVPFGPVPPIVLERVDDGYDPIFEDD